MSLEVKIKKRMGDFCLDVEFTSESGVTGLLGASGCGKSLTLRSIAGIIKPDEGYIVLNGKVLFDSRQKVSLPPQKRQVGYLFQNYALFPNMTVAQNIACGLPHEKNKKKKQEMVVAMMESMHLTGLESLKPHQLSGGQQQRTALARVLVGKPEVLLLDEPFSALDSYLKEQLMTELRKMLGYFDKDVLLVTHSRDEVYDLCDSMAIMESGKLIGMGRTKKIFSDPGTRTGAMLTGCKNIVPARAAGPRLVEIPRWGVTMHTGQDIREGLCAIGIRAHYFDEAITDNAFPVVIEELIEEPFAWIIKFRYEKQDSKSTPVWWRFSKEKKNPDGLQRTRLGIAPEDILLLYK